MVEQKIALEHRQQLVFAPQMQQAVKILILKSASFEQIIKRVVKILQASL